MQVETTTKITLDNVSYDVASLSPEVQQMVQYLDDWRQREVDLTSDLLMVKGALRDVQNAIVTQMQTDATAAATDSAAANEPDPVPATPKKKRVRK